jgi:hypothetical protein
MLPLVGHQLVGTLAIHWQKPNQLTPQNTASVLALGSSACCPWWVISLLARWRSIGKNKVDRLNSLAIHYNLKPHIYDPSNTLIILFPNSFRTGHLPHVQYNTKTQLTITVPLKPSSYIFFHSLIEVW